MVDAPDAPAPAPARTSVAPPRAATGPAAEPGLAEPGRAADPGLAAQPEPAADHGLSLGADPIASPTFRRAGRPRREVDGRRARGDSTRRAILGRAMQLASTDGLEDLSIARLASDLGMSKSGLFAHFGSKEQLQLSTVRAARRVFSDEAVTPAMAAKKGIERLDALIAAWHRYISSDIFAGGCLLMEAAAEFDNRPGPVRDLIAETMGMWMGLLVE